MPSLCTNRPSEFALFRSISEQVVRSCGCRVQPTSRYTAVIEGPIDHVMAIAGAFRKGRAITGPQDGLAIVFDQHQFAFDEENKLVLVAMPVTLARPTAGR